jgi:hypothetical protein
MPVDRYDWDVRSKVDDPLTDKPVTDEPLVGELLGAEKGPVPLSPEGHLEMLRMLSRWMDTVFEVPGLGWRFGLDPIIGLVPVLGDVVTSVISLYILAVAQHYQIPQSTKLRMGLNIATDYLVGSIPFLGNLFDFAWKANDRNFKLLERHIAAGAQERAKQSVWDWLVIAGIVVLLVGVLIGSLTIALFLAQSLVNLFREQRYCGGDAGLGCTGPCSRNAKRSSTSVFVKLLSSPAGIGDLSTSRY